MSLQPVLLERDRQVGDVDADPVRGRASARRRWSCRSRRRVEHHVAGVAAGRDDALQEGDGLLRGVAEAFGASRLCMV